MGLAEVQGCWRGYTSTRRCGIGSSPTRRPWASSWAWRRRSRDLAGVSRRQVEQFAGSLRRKRRDQVRRVIPIAARALGGRFGRLFDATRRSRRRGDRRRTSTTRSGSSMRSRAGPMSIGRPGSRTSPVTSWPGARPRGRDALPSCERFGSPSRLWRRAAGRRPLRLAPRWQSGGGSRRGDASDTSSSRYRHGDSEAGKSAWHSLAARVTAASREASSGRTGTVTKPAVGPAGPGDRHSRVGPLRNVKCSLRSLSLASRVPTAAAGARPTRPTGSGPSESRGGRLISDRSPRSANGRGEVPMRLHASPG